MWKSREDLEEQSGFTLLKTVLAKKSSPIFPLCLHNNIYWSRTYPGSLSLTKMIKILVLKDTWNHPLGIYCSMEKEIET